MNLRLPFNTLESLSEKQVSNEVKLSIVIHTWITTTSEQKLVTWGTVVAFFEAESTVKNLPIAKKIREFLASKAN